MVPISGLSHLANPLVTPEHLETSASQLDGVPKDLEDSIRYETAGLVQAAGCLLRLPQDLIAQSIIILYRFWGGADGGSMLEHDPRDVATTALYLTSKPSGSSVTPRQVLTVHEYLHAQEYDYTAAAKNGNSSTVDWTLSEGEYQIARNKLYAIESYMLRVLGFETHVALPYTLCINYLQTLDVFQSSDGSAVAKRAFAHLNTALLSPQLVYLTHQPTALATAAIYLAAREVGVKLAEANWWEVFDVDREDLGFLVVAMRSVAGFAKAERQKWEQSNVPLTVEGIQLYLQRKG